MNKRVDAMERYMESKMPEEVNGIIMLIEKNRLEFLDARDTLDKQVASLEVKLFNPSQSV